METAISGPGSVPAGWGVCEALWEPLEQGPGYTLLPFRDSPSGEGRGFCLDFWLATWPYVQHSKSQTERELGLQTGSECPPHPYPCSGEAPPCKQYEFLRNIQKARLSGKDVAHIPEAPTQARVPALHGHPSPQLGSPCQLNDSFPLVDSSCQRSWGLSPTPRS